jgi:hypothetical protein
MTGSSATLGTRISPFLESGFFRPLSRPSATIYIGCGERLAEAADEGGQIPHDEARALIRQVLAQHPNVQLDEDEGGQFRDLNQRASQFFNKLIEVHWLEPRRVSLDEHLELLPDPDRPIFQVRPVPGDCALMARFNKAETLLILTLWRMYHDQRMENVVAIVVVSANDIWDKLRLYFESIVPPTEAQLRDMLGRLRNRRLVRIQWSENTARFGESQVEILPTLPRVIPFENPEAWQQQANLYQAPADEPAEAKRSEEQP